jgi:N4-gp56 family major capsid protein
VAYTKRTNGADRVGSQFSQLSFASAVTAPSANRHYRWVDSTDTLAAGATNAVAAADLPTWKMLAAIKAQAEVNNIRPIRTEDGIEIFNVFMHSKGIAALKRDPEFISAWTHAQKRGDENPLFKGTKRGGRQGFYIDGLNIMEYRNVYNTTGAASGSKWGAGGAVDGQRILVCGAQALAVADIGLPKWVEKDFDYDNSPGVSIAKLLGMLKPRWRSSITGTVEDFGVMVVDTAI